MAHIRTSLVAYSACVLHIAGTAAPIAAPAAATCTAAAAAVLATVVVVRIGAIGPGSYMCADGRGWVPVCGLMQCSCGGCGLSSLQLSRQARLRTAEARVNV